MFRLTREVRFTVNSAADAPDASPTNGHAGYPAMTGVGQFFTLRVTLEGELEPRSSYLRNIKEIDDVVRRQAIPLIAGRVRAGFRGGRVDVAMLPHALYDALRDGWPGARVHRLELSLTPALSLALLAEEHPMTVRLNHRFEFSASHRLFNRELDDAENTRLFGKCANPHGHGHNYEVQVTLAGAAGDVGDVLCDLPAFERLVGAAVIDRLDHKNLNVEVPAFRDLIPSVENIAQVIYKLLARELSDPRGPRLASVTVWETPRTWCEYSE